MAQPEGTPRKLTRRQQRERRWRNDFSYIDAPHGVTTAEAIQYLATKTIDAALRRSLLAPRWKRDLRSLAGRGLLRGDPGVSFWMLNRDSVGPRDWRCVVRRGSHWVPLSITLSTCETQRRVAAHVAAFQEALRRVPASDTKISNGRLCLGTPEEEARRDEIYQIRHTALLESMERPVAGIQIQRPDPAESRRYLVLKLHLDIEEAAIDEALAQQVAHAFGATGPLIEIHHVAEHLCRLAEGGALLDSSPPAGFISWAEYARMLYRRGRFDALNKSVLDALRRSWLE